MDDFSGFGGGGYNVFGGGAESPGMPYGFGGQGGYGGSGGPSHGKLLGLSGQGWLKALGTAAALYTAYEGAQQQKRANQINEQTLQQLQQQRHLGKLIGEKGAPGNPFSGQYGSLFGGVT